MAGQLVVIESEIQKSAIEDLQWEVHYSRFFNYPPLSSSHASLSSYGDVHRRRHLGNWISSSSTALLALNTRPSNSELVLTITLRSEILEEHYIHTLHFSWPHVSCMSGFASRGSRVLIVSFKDCIGQLQKFALRFLLSSEVESFMNTLKEKIHCVVPLSKIDPEISSQSECIPSIESLYRPKEDWHFTTSVDTIETSTHPKQLNSNSEASQNNSPCILSPDAEGLFGEMPPSFTSLLMSCHLPIVQAEAQPTGSSNDLRHQIKKYLGESSFQDILSQVEKVMHEIGDDFLL
ncbi:protein POOR HOMOLOGOUS SYNAPSIS 1 [Impatiens glandulifera]|uniref:protein POOR HOMOLOGOUS SYNAPSIS 1 n=1 Tax=Impatiens glandulifera TaxID=253017 RepID=UPI001FB13880|nr:protein POOR HOMOLOGOUS SYNAPSIS 1 [Impatiens glandulifera]